MNYLTSRQKRRYRIRKRVFGTQERPRLSVFRSNKNMYVQVIDDVSGKTLVYADDTKLRKGLKRLESSRKLGEEVALKCSEKKITQIVFDRGGYNYHGRVKELADGARSKGLSF